MILWGNKDKIVPRDGVMHVYRNIKSDSVTLYEIDNVTHDSFKNDRYDEILKIITLFLREIPIPGKQIKKI